MTNPVVPETTHLAYDVTLLHSVAATKVAADHDLAMRAASRARADSRSPASRHALPSPATAADLMVLFGTAYRNYLPASVYALALDAALWPDD